MICGGKEWLTWWIAASKKDPVRFIQELIDLKERFDHFLKVIPPPPPRSLCVSLSNHDPFRMHSRTIVPSRTRSSPTSNSSSTRTSKEIGWVMEWLDSFQTQSRIPLPLHWWQTEEGSEMRKILYFIFNVFWNVIVILIVCVFCSWMTMRWNRCSIDRWSSSDSSPRRTPSRSIFIILFIFKFKNVNTPAPFRFQVKYLINGVSQYLPSLQILQAARC